ncbi:unnamed protein product [Cunninghamella echinulata]
MVIIFSKTFYPSSSSSTIVPPLLSLSISPNAEAMNTVCDNGAALDILESAIANYKRPTIFILIIMFDMLLKPKEVTSHPYLKRQVIMDRIHTLLLNCVEIFGSDLFVDIWNMFRSFHLFGLKTRKQQLIDYLTSYHHDVNNEDDKPDNINDKQLLDQGFMAFEDFWDFVYKAFTSKEPLQIKGYLYVLDVMIEILERDFRSKKESSASAKKSILVLLLEKKMGAWNRFEKYLNIIVNVFDHHQFINHTIDIERMGFAGKLLNMMIALSYYDDLLSRPSLIKQTHRIITILDADDYIRCLQHISFHTFIIQLCDLEFMYADFSHVEASYQNMKKNINTLSRSEKWENIITKVQPKNMNIYSIYQHVLLVHQYYTSLHLSSTIRINQSVIHDLTNNNCQSLAKSLLIDSKQTLKTWYNEVEKWLSSAASAIENDNDTKMRHHIEYLLDNFRNCF